MPLCLHGLWGLRLRWWWRRVQILTHTREKQQFVKKKNARLAGEVAAFDAQLGSQRDALSKVRAPCCFFPPRSVEIDGLHTSLP